MKALILKTLALIALVSSLFATAHLFAE